MTTMFQLLMECGDGLKIFGELFPIIMQRDALLRQLTHHFGLRNARNVSRLAQSDLIRHKGTHSEKQLGMSRLESPLHSEGQWQGQSHTVHIAMRSHLGNRASLTAARD